MPAFPRLTRSVTGQTREMLKESREPPDVRSINRLVRVDALEGGGATAVTIHTLVGDVGHGDVASFILDAGLGRKFRFLAGSPILSISIWQWGLFRRYVGPYGGILAVDFEPMRRCLWISVGKYRLRRAFRNTNSAVDALVRVYHQHVLTLIEAVYGTDFHTVGVLAFDAILGDDVGHADKVTLPLRFFRMRSGS